MAAAVDPRLRQLKIKTGVVKRIAREKRMYEGEVVDQGQKVEKMIADDIDIHDIRKQKEVLEESRIMIPDCRRRLKTAYEDLTNLVAETKSDFAEKEEFKNAKAILSETTLDD